jgi:hypothetical protein
MMKMIPMNPEIAKKMKSPTSAIYNDKIKLKITVEGIA